MLRKYTKALPAEAFQDTDGDAVSVTSEGKAYEDLLLRTRDQLRSDKTKSLRDQLDTEIKTLTPGNTQTITLLENLSVAYVNDSYIGNRLMPIVGTTDEEGMSIEYWSRDKKDAFGAPDDTMTTDGEANDVSRSASLVTCSLAKKSLKAGIDVWNRDMMKNVVYQLVDPTVSVAESMAFKEEERIATILTTSGNFGSNTVAIAAADRWDVGGDPGAIVDTAIESLWTGAGATRLVGYCSYSVYKILKRHPKILDTFKYNGNAPMQATRQMLAEYFELDELLVGGARKQTNNEGQTATYGRMWSNVFGVLRVATAPSRFTLHFGTTFKQRMFQQTWFDPTKGGRGKQFTQLATAVAHKVVSADAGYLITTPIG